MGGRSSRPSPKKTSVDNSSSKTKSSVSSTSNNTNSFIESESFNSYLARGAKDISSDSGTIVKCSSVDTTSTGDVIIVNKFRSSDSLFLRHKQSKSPTRNRNRGNSIGSSETEEDEESNFRNFYNTLGLPDGIHKWSFHSGDIYNGEWRGGTMHGSGILHLVNSKVVYRGEFRHGVYHGKGAMTYDSGDVFTGSFLNGDKNGHGVVKYASGNQTFKGIWKKDKLVKSLEGTVQITPSTDNFATDASASPNSSSDSGGFQHDKESPRLACQG